MKTNFTTGIPEIDRLTGSKIENGSFLLAAGNDDEGMFSFLAEIENINERRAGKEKNESNGCKIVKINSKFLEDLNKLRSLFDNEKKEEKEEERGEFSSIFIIESISELLSPECYSKEISFEEHEIIHRLRQICSVLKSESESEQKEKSIVIGLLHENILTTGTENRIKHISDSYFRFRMEEKGTQFERTLSVYKYKGGSIGGKILKYNLEDGKIKIETKKRIY